MCLGPMIREELVKLTGFQGIDSGENIGHVSQGINAILFGRDNQRKMDGSGLATGIGACKKKIFAGQNKLLNCAFTSVVANIEIRIIQEPGQGNPVVESITDSFHQWVLGAESGLHLKQSFLQLIEKRSGGSLSCSQSFLGRLAFNLLLHIVQLVVNIENLKANIGVERQALVVSAA